jgi:hypothetical protein
MAFLLVAVSLSENSAVMNHCGVGHTPVDFIDRVKAKIYQPYIMQIYDSFNQWKENSTDRNGSRGGIDIIQDLR